MKTVHVIDAEAIDHQEERVHLLFRSFLQDGYKGPGRPLLTKVDLPGHDRWAIQVPEEASQTDQDVAHGYCLGFYNGARLWEQDDTGGERR